MLLNPCGQGLYIYRTTYNITCIAPVKKRSAGTGNNNHHRRLAVVPATGNISSVSIRQLTIVSYPEPILRKKCRPIERFGPQLQELATRMWQLMHDRNGVGLAAPQVGLPWRMFVWNPTGEAEDDHVSINPQLSDLHDPTEAEEGCLSIEGVTVNIRRARTARLDAQLPDGAVCTFAGEDLVARVWQHERDHLDGRLILDYMSAAETIANRRSIRELEARYKRKRSPRR